MSKEWRKITVYAVSDSMAQRAASLMSDLFGGATIAPPGLGYWWDGQIPPLMHVETAFLVHSLSEDFPLLERFAHELAKRLAEEFKQQTVLFTIEPMPVVRFVSAKDTWAGDEKGAVLHA